MNVCLRRIKDGVTQLRTSDCYLIRILDNCSFANFVKMSRMGATYMINKDLDEIPDNNTYVFCKYFEEGKDGGNG